MGYAPPDAEAEIPHSPPDRGLAAAQLRKLAQVSAAAVELAQQINRRATEADWIGGEGAMTFVRVARAARLTVAMEIRIGGYEHARTDRLLQKLGAVSGAGLDLCRLVTRLSEDRRCSVAQGAVMFGRLSAATRQTIALERRLDEEDCMTPERRAALQARRDAAAAARQARAEGEAATTPADGEAATAPADGDAEDDKVHRHEWLEDPDIDAELGDRSVDDVLVDACEELGLGVEGGAVAAALTPALSRGAGEGAPSASGVRHSQPVREADAGGKPFPRIAGEGGARRVSDGKVRALVHDPP